MQIINLYYELARQHAQIKSFVYGRGFKKGAGNNVYPMVWLDDPIAGQAGGNNTIRYTTNIDVLDVPTSEAQIATVQDAAFSAALAIIEQIKKTRTTSGVNVDAFNFVSLSDYYDDKAAGYRFTISLIAANPVDRCAEVFDQSKVFDAVKTLPDFLVENPEGCAVFNDGLPTFVLPGNEPAPEPGTIEYIYDNTLILDTSYIN